MSKREQERRKAWLRDEIRAAATRAAGNPYSRTRDDRRAYILGWLCGLAGVDGAFEGELDCLLNGVDTAAASEAT